MSQKEWQRCLQQQLEPVLTASDSGVGLSTYTDMPFGIFLYPPEDEWELRQALRDLVVRLENAGKTVQRLSMAQLLEQSIKAAGLSMEEIAEAERTMNLEIVRDTIRDVLSGKAAGSTPLDQLVAEEILKLLQDLQNELGVSYLFITHDLAVASQICKRIVVMYAGQDMEDAQQHARAKNLN
jgi:hypothetical protein